MKRSLKLLWIGLKRHPSRFLKSWFLAYSAVWTIMSSFAFFFPVLRPTSWSLLVVGVLALMAIGSLLWGFYRVFPKRKVQIRMQSIDTTISVEFGDLFEAEGGKAIAVNEFFDSQLGEPVARRSLHGQLIERKFQDHPETFDKLVAEELRNEPFEEVERTGGNNKRYEIGTTAVIKIGAERFFFPALSKTDVGTFKAYCDVPILLKALDGLWSAVRTRAGGERVSVPLIGGGLSGIGLPPYQLLQMIILSIIIANKNDHIRSEICIFIARELMEEIDLDTLESQWS